MKSKKFIALLCSAAIGAAAVPYMGYAAAVTKETAVLAAADTMRITKQGGSLESVYVEWENTAETSGYTVTYREANSSSEKTVDKQLVRRYANHYRADIPGLKAGTYTVTVTDGAGNSISTENIDVKAHTREGFAFSAASPNGGNASGGYNSDGTVPADATIVYITQENVNSVTASIGGKSYTGLCDILSGISNATKKASNPAHYIIRMVGELDGSKITFDANANKEKQIFYVQDLKNLTIEGIGEDAVLNGCAFLFKGCSNTEMRNIGVMLHLDDGIAIEGDNSNIWIHNNDIFYGKDLSPETGDGTGDSDQVKGDGSLDVKGNSQYCTLSYNHFWDSGKASLVIASAKNVDDTTSFLTYQHNWFDHSDSRHPRIRMATVHMYNNYFDGNSKYGTGVTSGASAFVEANYYRGFNHPMMSSMQGSDSGTFSKEAGGVIKAYNNYFDGEDNTIYYSSSTGSDFDAYLASSRTDTVPNTVTTKQNTFKTGGQTYTYNNTYNNFDTEASMYSYTPDNPADVKDIVTSYAGRINGGDIKFTFSADDDRDHDVNAELKSKLYNYESPIIQKYSGVSGELYPATDKNVPVVTQTPATVKPTSTPKPASTPTSNPDKTASPTVQPTEEPTESPTVQPTEEPTESPTAQPTDKPDDNPYTIELNIENNVITAVMQSETADIEAQGFVAQYDANGRLVGISSQSWTGGNNQLTADVVSGAAVAKGFVWNTNYEPLAKVKNVNIEQ